MEVNMNKLEKIEAVKKQLMLEWECTEDFFSFPENKIIKSDKSFFEMLTFGNNAAIRVNEKLYEWCKDNLQNKEAKRIMDGDILFQIEKKLREFEYALAGEHVRYLYINPNTEIIKPEGFSYKFFEKVDMPELYVNKGFNNALNYKNDVIAYGAYKNGELVALAGADDYMNNMWQIGIDVLLDHRKSGLATYLVKALAEEIESRNKIAYYTTWGGNIPSTKVALNVGFYPIWVSFHAESVNR
jgi:GNAT superfamily N-acetyltransferase